MIFQFTKMVEISNIKKAIYLFRENPQLQSIESVSKITINLEKQLIEFEGSVSLEMYNGAINFNILNSECRKNKLIIKYKKGNSGNIFSLSLTEENIEISNENNQILCLMDKEDWKLIISK